MTYSIYDAFVPPAIRMLKNLSAILDKAVIEAGQKGIPLQQLLDARLAPDMFAFPRQIQIACFTAVRGGEYLRGAEPPEMPAAASTFDGLKGGIDQTVRYLEGLDPAAYAGAETRHIVAVGHGQTREYVGADFLRNWVLPNLYFHVTTAYALLRHNGIDVGKRDYLGA